jgi:hypothetical protein
VEERGRALIVAACAGSLFGAGTASGSGYAEMRAAAAKRCEAIDPAEYQTGLMLNPDGYRSYYVRSACYQRAAVEFRDESLCREVKRRWSLFSSSWGYSGKHCRQLVEDAVAGDRKELEEKRSRYRQGAVTLRDFQIERNGNGRDFDIVPAFEPGWAHGYTLRFEIVEAAAGGSVLLDTSGFYLSGNDNIRVFVRQADIRQRFAGFELGRPYRVRGTLTLSVATGRMGGRWSDAFIERVFPAAERSQSLVKDAVF